VGASPSVGTLTPPTRRHRPHAATRGGRWRLRFTMSDRESPRKVWGFLGLRRALVAPVGQTMSNGCHMHTPARRRKSLFSHLAIARALRPSAPRACNMAASGLRIIRRRASAEESTTRRSDSDLVGTKLEVGVPCAPTQRTATVRAARRVWSTVRTTSKLQGVSAHPSSSTNNFGCRCTCAACCVDGPMHVNRRTIALVHLCLKPLHVLALMSCQLSWMRLR
jgi:hypothetical protein